MSKSPALRQGGLFQRAGFKKGELSTPKHDEIVILLDSYIHLVMDRERERFPQITYRTIWELPVSDSYGRAVGNIDLTLQISISYEAQWEERNVGGTWKKLRQNSVSLFDVMHFEVKPEIRSIGELIRQINKYRSHIGNFQTSYQNGFTKYAIPEFIVVSPDSRFEPIIRSQGVGFFCFPRPGLSCDLP